MTNTEYPFFKTKTGRFITMDEMMKAAEIIWGEDPDFYMDWYEIRDRIGAIEMTPKQVYDYALNKEDKILAIRAYRAIKAEQGDRYYSLLSARDHVEKILEKRNKIWNLKHTTNTNIKLEEVKEGLNFLNNYKGE